MWLRGSETLLKILVRLTGLHSNVTPSTYCLSTAVEAIADSAKARGLVFRGDHIRATYLAKTPKRLSVAISESRRSIVAKIDGIPRIHAGVHIRISE